jgi:peptidoglycan/LPS O-acetylase OafA/YrhL
MEQPPLRFSPRLEIAASVTDGSLGRLQRSTALDRLRASAILSVVVYHIVLMSPVSLPGLARITWYGQYGVDLFFVLSGWLIGGLYWREMKAFGGVRILRFWVRRWMRTVPPYFAALVLSWLAVWSARGEAFDWGYLAFLQNYYDRIPFFLVSWSLCIEEHFYLAAPVVAGICVALVPRNWHWLPWVLLIGASPLLRWLEWSQVPSEGFGYVETATHLRLDGLVLGFGLSRVDAIAPVIFRRVARWSWPAVAGCIAGLVAFEWMGGILRYTLWSALIALLCSAILVASVSRERTRDSAFTGTGRVPWTTVALASYSAYLIHPLAIHAARRIVSLVGDQLWLIYWPIAVALIVVATAIFYICVERRSITIRNAWVPPRTALRTNL